MPGADIVQGNQNQVLDRLALGKFQPVTDGVQNIQNIAIATVSDGSGNLKIAYSRARETEDPADLNFVGGLTNFVFAYNVASSDLGGYHGFGSANRRGITIDMCKPL